MYLEIYQLDLGVQKATKYLQYHRRQRSHSSQYRRLFLSTAHPNKVRPRWYFFHSSHTYCHYHVIAPQTLNNMAPIAAFAHCSSISTHNQHCRRVQA